jgi:hypothetical protein
MRGAQRSRAAAACRFAAAIGMASQDRLDFATTSSLSI